MSKYFLIVLVLINYSFPLQRNWSSTPVDYFINHNFRQMTFREPFYLIPYDLKIGLFSYGGPGYFNNIIKGSFDLDANPIILDNQDINDSFISSIDSRLGYFIELDRTLLSTVLNIEIIFECKLINLFSIACSISSTFRKTPLGFLSLSSFLIDSCDK